ncbi:MAG: phage holin family protein [Myxococcaceae bacterium]
MRAEDQDRGGLSSALSRLTDSAARLLADHLALARAEIREDVRALGRDVAVVTAFVPLLVVGYALVCVALALALSSWLGSAGGFAAVGVANLLVGSVAVVIAARRLKRTDVMDDSRAEVERSAALFRSSSQSPGKVEPRLGA